MKSNCERWDTFSRHVRTTFMHTFSTLLAQKVGRNCIKGAGVSARHSIVGTQDFATGGSEN